MKKILISLIIIFVIVGLAYILIDITITNSIADNSRFIEISREIAGGHTIIMFYDKETKVIYATKPDYRNDITVMLNAEGKPLLYED